MEMQLSDMQSLVQRLAKLESENPRFKRGAAALAVIVSALFLLGQTQSQRTVEAEEFVLKDKVGNMRAKLTVEMNHKPMLTFLDGRGNIPLALVGNDKPGISISRPGTQDLVVLAAGKEFSGLAIYQREIRAGLTVQKGISGLDLFNENGNPQVTLNFSSLGSSLTMSDPNRKADLSMAVAPALRGANVSMSDSTGEPRVFLARLGKD